MCHSCGDDPPLRFTLRDPPYLLAEGSSLEEADEHAPGSDYSLSDAEGRADEESDEDDDGDYHIVNEEEVVDEEDDGEEEEDDEEEYVSAVIKE
mmetsp:Transcript_28336/g.86672  ORF Transcript_28336/g.86672 Transcript_28336/m.86672 type:complete len:94 (+) Transcript_28336:48-329(+)